MEHIEYLEYIQNKGEVWMPIQLLNKISHIGKETEHQKLKEALREYYVEVRNSKNPFNQHDGSIANKKALDRLNEIIIEIIDLLNDYYGNYKTITKPKQ